MADKESEHGQIGLVGLGSMGFALAENLLASGYSVTGFDVRDEPLHALESIGGTSAADPKSLATACRSVHVIVSNDEQAESVVYGERGIFAGFENSGLATEQLLVVHSTLIPSTVVDFAENAPENVTVLDAAISASKSPASGDITLMIGGDLDSVEWYKPVLEVLSGKMFLLGSVGSGVAAKLVNNVVHHTAEVATLEALKIGTQYGIDREKLLAVFVASSGNTEFAQNYDYYTQEILKAYPAGPAAFSGNIRKNLSQALKLAYDLEVDVPVTGHVSQEAPRWFRKLAEDIETD